MSFDQAIGTPFTLASLSKPVRSTNGRVHAAGVCSASGVKKRKRTEIVVGLDGEGLSIYSLQNPQLVTSYALPPSASLTSAPFSIYRKGSSKTPTQRFTYASLAGTTAVDKPQLVCFHEKTRGDQSETVKTSYTHSEYPAQLLALDALPVAAGGSAKDATHDVLAAFDNGDVICLSADLEAVRWVANLTLLVSPRDPRVELEHVSLTNAKAASRGLLRSRGDIAAVLNPMADETSDLLELTQILCVIGRKSDGSRTLGLLQVQSRSPDLATNHLSPLKHLVSWNLPKPPKISTSITLPPQFDLNAPSGSLHILDKGALLTYDLSGTTPKLNSELSISSSSVDSFLRTAQDVLFTISQDTCRVFDAKFNSLQALLALDPSSGNPDATSPSKKRKLAQTGAAGQGVGACSLVAYYADIGLVVAAREDEIFGMQFGGIGMRKRMKTDSTLLIDALGKGICSNPPTAPNHENKWQERKAKLNRYAAKGKIAKFEEAFATALGIQLESVDAAKKRENEANGGPVTNGVGPKLPDADAMVIDKLDDGSEIAEDELRRWKTTKVRSNNQLPQYRQYALYALSKIFRWIDADVTSEAPLSKASPRGSLKVDFFPPNVFQWLLQTGNLTKESIRRSILDEMPSKPQSTSIISDGDITKALVEFDPDLHILSAVLNHDQFLPIGEVVQAIKLLIQNIGDEPEQNEVTKRLTNGTAPSEDEMDVDIASELEAASHEIDHALSILDQGLLIRSHTLRPALIRLHTFPTPTISSALRSMLSRRDLESLIRLLHLELKNGGWTSSYDFVDVEDSALESSTEDPDDHAVTIIASLLSSTLDAIGAGAFLTSIGSPSSPESSEEIINSLHGDTSEALNGFWEARYMRGLLSEFLRYASNVPKSQKPSNEKLQGQGKPFLVTGKLSGEEDLPMLPLGGKGDLGIERMKKGLSGRKEERSKREMGMLISKRVPKYSFERIVI
ncbi:uncharacterized protein K460DRAFT_306091 [Cucurbitaria berberidis CBS 394.84]|uniref:Uncharacterized protein n=1 Tax=Cucurbitaria berberidis CBS 394.84 TaxID=1168544 RepID=A0A9P4LAG4_9PLEO|nr:uncharacterized protein K460DRAFT_306091 [Cucurbitaria berberidis CBS 394.84]KAF1847174.1 hypothetical protein K460DRAFT_306091 [Cucurbitaria berberidis CBS 394.84]